MDTPVATGLEGHRQRLRERFARTGFRGFADHEILELLLTLCIPRRDVKGPARSLLARFGSVRQVLDASEHDLREIAGIGSVTPVALRVIREAASLYLQQGVEEAPESLNSTSKLEALWRSRLGGLTHEVFEVGYLDSAYRLLRDGVERLETGTIDRAFVYPRKVMANALRRSAFALVLAHNHPNGRASPSDADKRLTQSLLEAAAALQIKVIDHLIVTREEVFSFRRAHLL